MPRFVIPPEDLSGGRFLLKGDNAHHASRVLRLKAGDSIELSNGEGLRWVGKIESVDLDGPSLTGHVLKEYRAPERKTKVILCQGLPKGDKFEYVIEKSVELGVDEILPFFSEKNPISWTPEKAAQKTERWNRLVQAAVKQSGSPIIPTVHVPVGWLALQKKIEPEKTLVCHPGEGSVSFKSALEKKRGEGSLFLLVGPESGFSDGEVNELSAAGATCVHLGPSILRTETAGPALLAVIRFFLGDWENL